MIKFGTDGIRFVYNDDSLLIVKAVALAVKILMREKSFIIGNDGRNSGEIIENAFLEYFDYDKYEKLGIVPSGCVAYIASQGFDYGVMITASHNNYTYNGIKFFDKNGQKIDDETQNQIELLANKFYDELLNNKTNIDSGDVIVKSDVIDTKSQLIKPINLDLIEKYCNFIKKLIKTDCLKGKKIIIDCANGGTSKIINKILSNENEYHFINTYVKLNKINENCGALHTEILKQVVVANKAYLGIAFDGDADRIVVIDRKGKQIDGGVLLDNFAREYCNNKSVVGTIYTNLAVVNDLEKNNIKFVSGGVGDRSVIDKMNKLGAYFGGEPSGHYIFKNLLNTGDGLVSFAMLLNMLGKRKLQKVKLYYDSSLVVQKGDKNFIKNSNYEKEYKDMLLKYQNANIIIRESGTEPVIRINVQMKNKNKAIECSRLAEKVVINNLL